MRRPQFAVFVAALSAASAMAGEITLKGANDLAWEVTSEGVAFAPLQGDRFREPYHALVELPAGTISPPHTKTATMIGLMLQGEMIHYSAEAAAADAPVIGPGGYYQIPAGMAHVSACVSEQPCVTYLYQDGAFDFLPVAP